MGLTRVLAAVMPLSALICLRGLSGIYGIFDWNKTLRAIATGIILFLVIKAPFNQWYWPYHLEGEDRVAIEAGEWFTGSEYKNRKVYYLHPYLTLALDIDPFDRDKK